MVYTWKCITGARMMLQRPAKVSCAVFINFNPIFFLMHSCRPVTFLVVGGKLLLCYTGVTHLQVLSDTYLWTVMGRAGNDLVYHGALLFAATTAGTALVCEQASWKWLAYTSTFSCSPTSLVTLLGTLLGATHLFCTRSLVLIVC